MTIVHSFGDGSVPNDGAGPSGVMQASDGNFYGTTRAGGTANKGTVFKMTPMGELTIVHNFDDGNIPNDGYLPNALVQGNDGNFYGTTFQGGSNDCGSVFKITLAGIFSILHSFNDGIVAHDGCLPQAALVEGNDGNFYGTTGIGGFAGLYGTVFRISPTGTVTILHSFGDGSVAGDGSDPVAPLVLGTDDNFYGTTMRGGTTSESMGGTIFKMTPAGTASILHNFGDSISAEDGLSPQAALIQASDGNFYGTTFQGGTANIGTIFRVTTSGDVTILHSFGDETFSADGYYPSAALYEDTDGNLYGTTEEGGTVYPNEGTVFRLSVPSLGSSLEWTAPDTASAPDGTARILWTRSDGAAGVWIMNAGDIQSEVGHTYGPYTGWSAKTISVAGDGSSRVLWTNINGEAGVWALDANGHETKIGPSYGPFPGWTAADIAATPGGNSHLLWTRSDGAAGVWTLNSAGAETVVGPTYGPYLYWTAKAIGSAGDATSRILWTRSDGEAGLWSMTPNDTLQTIGPTYGPYSDSHGTWGATDMGTSSDGTSKVLWSRSDGAVGLWTFSVASVNTAVGSIYGPYAGYTATALDSANDQSRLLWTRTDRAAGLWSFGVNDIESVIGSVYGPY